MGKGLFTSAKSISPFPENNKDRIGFMEIIAHRGWWTSKEGCPGNSFAAFKLALDYDYGIEVDIRDFKQELVVSHNPADASSLKLVDLLTYYQNNQCSSRLAFNVKADGLQPLLQEILSRFSLSNYFTFDMSIPNTLVDASYNLQYFLRQSEYEPTPSSLLSLYSQAAGIWVDQFQWNERVFQHNLATLKDYLQEGKKVCWVSAELHEWGRKASFYRQTWKRLKDTLQVAAMDLQNFSICTDYPELAKEVFKDAY